MFLGLIPTGQIKMPYLIALAIAGMLWAAVCKVGVAWLFGDHLRKSTPKELRWASAFFAFMPIWGAVCVYFGRSYLERAGALSLWFWGVGATLGFAIWIWIWTRFVSAKVSWWFGGIVWAITLWLAFTNKLV